MTCRRRCVLEAEVALAVASSFYGDLAFEAAVRRTETHSEHRTIRRLRSLDLPPETATEHFVMALVSVGLAALVGELGWAHDLNRPWALEVQSSAFWQVESRAEFVLRLPFGSLPVGFSAAVSLAQMASSQQLK